MTPALPIALSLVGVVLLAGGVLVFFHIRNRKRRAANRASGGKRAWVNRKAGWAKMADEGAEIARPAVARVAYCECTLKLTCKPANLQTDGHRA